MLDLHGVGNGTQGFIYASRALSHWVTHPVLLELFRLAVSGQECGPSHWQSPAFHLQHWKLREAEEQNWLDSRQYNVQHREPQTNKGYSFADFPPETSFPKLSSKMPRSPKF